MKNEKLIKKLQNHLSKGKINIKSTIKENTSKLKEKYQSSLSMAKMYSSRAFQELFPFIYFYYISTKLNKKLNDIPTSKIQLYLKLTNEQIESRLKDEHERAQKIDEKTSKFTLGLSISLSIISATASGAVKLLPKSNINEFISLLFGFSSLYMLSGGLIALGALKTLPKFGYGTIFEIDKNTITLAKSLISQENVNILRHIRNESSFMSLRNGFIIIFAALSLCVIALAQQIGADNISINVDKIICTFCSSLAYEA